ncbi:MAG TPA: TlpA disulfide reductase family protein [Solirubrobacteraceae bacterium]
MSRRLRLLGLALLAAAAVAALAVFGLASSGSASGRAAPALPSEHLAGAHVTLPGLLATAGGRPSLVVFWASWCGPCEREAAALQSFSQSPEGRGRVVGVNWSDALAGARAFIRRYGWTFPNVRDAEGIVGNAYRLTGLPTTFVLDGRGRIARVLRGPQDEASLARALTAAERA